METEFWTRIAAFLSQYLHHDGSPVPPTEVFCRAGLKMLAREGVMTVEEICQEALRDYFVIIPQYLFQEEDK